MKLGQKDIIMIVDDQPANLKVLLSFLQERNFEIRILGSGRQAIAMLQDITPDIILLDVLMPEMDGFETCKKIKANKKIADIPVIFMTALDTLEDKVAGFEAGGVDYITKPFRQTEVLVRINTHISLRKKALKLKEMQEELLLQKKMLESLLSSIPDPIYFKDTENKYLGCNRAFEELAGKQEKDIIGKDDDAVLSKGIADSFRRKDEEMLVSGTSKRTEELVLYPDGGEVFLDILKTPYIGPDGNLLGLIGTSRNINALKQAKQQTEEERERLSVTLYSIGDGVISTDVEGGTVFINRAAEELTGWSNAEAAGRPFTELFRIFDEKTGEKSANPVAEILKSGKKLDIAENTVLLRRNGTKLSIADSGAPIRDRENKIIGVVIIFRDVTQKKKMEQERAKIRKLESVGVLAGGIAHDFNNILSAILGNIELASSRVYQDGETFSLLADAKKATIRATKLTYQLLTFSKGGEPVKEKTSLIDLIRESADFVLHGSLVSCDYIFADNLWMIHADSGQISQVIQNIILNAKDAMPNGGKITINCRNVEDLASGLLLSRHKGNFVHITVQDTGSGISSEIMDKIFDPYFTTKEEGNGLGLAICHSIIKKHDGHITVRSSPQHGTIFSLYLPAVSPVDSPVPEERQKEPTFRSTRIMVMDDDSMLRTLAEAQLRSLGHEAVLAKDGAEAISLYQKMSESRRPINLVILDLTIPGGMGGREAAQKLLLLDPAAKLIVASGYSNDPVLAEYKEYGFRAAVAKPFNLKELGHAIASALS